jgi:hypothetical protein
MKKITFNFLGHPSTDDSKMLEKSGVVKLNNFLLLSSSVDEDEDVDSVSTSIGLTFC